MILNADKRELYGSNAAKRIRDQGQCPGVVYGPKCEPIHISVQRADLEQMLRSQNPMLHPFKIDVAGKKHEVLLKSYDTTYCGNLLHADFIAIAKGAKVHVAVPIQFEHEEQCVGKREGGVVDHHVTALDVEVLPKDIPDSIVVDIANLAIGSSIHLSDIKLPKGLVLQQPIDENHDPVLVSCEPPKIELEEADVPEEVSEEAEVETEVNEETNSESNETQET